ncbi:MAG: hypothetical protein PVJ92_02015 [Candidatus Dependentiae bacterium]
MTGQLLRCITLTLLTGCSPTPEHTDNVPPLTVKNLHTTLVTTPQQHSTLQAHTAQLDNAQTRITGTTITAQLRVTDGPPITLTAPHAEWNAHTQHLTATGTVTASHDAGWLRARSATCDASKQTIFLKGPVESILKL